MSLTPDKAVTRHSVEIVDEIATEELASGIDSATSSRTGARRQDVA